MIIQGNMGYWEISVNDLLAKMFTINKISKFESLQNLDLNFTDINGSGLKELSGLKYLKSLSLSGTKVNFSKVKPLVSLKSLEELTIWNTSFSEKDIQELKKLNKKI